MPTFADDHGWFLTYHEIPELRPALAGRPGVRDPERGRRDLARPDPPGRRRDARRSRGSPSSSTRVLPRCPDPGMALTNLERFVAAVPPARRDARASSPTTPARPRSCCSALQHQPVLQRGPDPRPRAARLAAAGAATAATARP